jgi:hypothetical protein
MLASTDWHELLVPFSEFSRISPWTVDGYRLFLKDVGVLDSAEKIVPVAPPAELRLCREHKVYFADQSRRDAALLELPGILWNNNLSEHLILKLDAKRRKAEEGFCFALYLFVPEFDPEERTRARQWLATTRWKNDIDEQIPFLEAHPPRMIPREKTTITAVCRTGSLQRYRPLIGFSGCPGQWDGWRAFLWWEPLDVTSRVFHR